MKKLISLISLIISVTVNCQESNVLELDSKINRFSHIGNSNILLAANSDGYYIEVSPTGILKTYYPVVIDYNNSTLLRIQTKPELKYFIKEVEVSEKRFYELINSIDVSGE
ncbi:hypothetical protein [Tenacibaculum finnmarkense]|uniref:hypothetical protein n=1 Tax=Tenacibaculum finnmarkense TaxID=2781243 RepID=UPI001EFAEE8D|nr:hypothetical protein [Tenacibaculum finnmarkense]MCG8239826.1 hypothetical protein [Tenacibaculum finnmarkense genomovar ulcerans]